MRRKIPSVGRKVLKEEFKAATEEVKPARYAVAVNASENDSPGD